jgi:hypothetical protein
MAVRVFTFSLDEPSADRRETTLPRKEFQALDLMMLSYSCRFAWMLYLFGIVSFLLGVGVALLGGVRSIVP